MKILSKLIIDPNAQEQFRAKGGYSAVNLLFDTY